ncbi:MAG: biopolymer transporter ExbD [Gammaproteobacteria bacterium]|nr:MAG: biopolymer transporter ExbD [Gammaproteobacteria bacterium]
MRFRRARREEEPAINLTPLIDVVFLLLIFFMVSTTFDRPTHLSISLPRASSEAPPEEREALVLTIDAQGNYYLRRGRGPERRVVSRAEAALERALRQMAQAGAGEASPEGTGQGASQGRPGAGAGEPPPLVISADARTPHQAVVTAMDAARRAGYHRLAIAAIRRPEGGR